MKWLKHVLYSLFSLCLFFLMVIPASAKEEYTYTIRFFAGRQGSFAGGEMIAVEGLHYGDRVTFHQNEVVLNDNSKYYIRGIRESGKDNSESTQASSFLVTGDKDYVVAYGILGDATSYTINYRDEAGNILAPSETYYGNVGDRPVVAYLYIEGWTPQAYNMTQTLKKDPAENVFNFVYTRETEAAGGQPAPAPAPVPAAPAAEAPAVRGVTVIPAPVQEEPADDGPEAGVVPAAEDGGADEDDGQDEVELPDGDVPAANGPEELVDLDDEDVPMSNFLSIAADARLLGIPVPVIIVICLGAVGAALYFLILKKRRRKEEES